MAVHGQPWWVQVIFPVIVVIVLALRWRGMRSARTLRLETLWVLPAVYATGVLYTVYRVPLSLIGWLSCAVALVIGSLIGWYRGRMMRITIDQATHKLSQQGSPAALILLAVLIAARQGLRYEMGSGKTAMLALEIAMALSLAMVVVTRLEMAIRARKMLFAARQAVTTGVIA